MNINLANVVCELILRIARIAREIANGCLEMVSESRILHIIGQVNIIFGHVTGREALETSAVEEAEAN